MQRRRRRYLDKYKMGKSSTVPYLANESWSDRHRRRKEAALERQKEVERWCAKVCWKLYVKNGGHHWIFYTQQRKTIEWFPSSGKLAIGKRWNQAIHVHDIDQLLDVLSVCVEEEIGKTGIRHPQR